MFAGTVADGELGGLNECAIGRMPSDMWPNYDF